MSKTLKYVLYGVGAIAVLVVVYYIAKAMFAKPEPATAPGTAPAQNASVPNSANGVKFFGNNTVGSIADVNAANNAAGNNALPNSAPASNLIQVGNVPGLYRNIYTGECVRYNAMLGVYSKEVCPIIISPYGAN